MRDSIFWKLLHYFTISVVLGCLALLLIHREPNAIVAQQPKEAKKKESPDAPLVLRGATIHTASGPVIENGVLVVHKGKIVAVGAAGTVKIPKDARIRDVAGKVIIPGLVDTHSHVGIFPRPQVPAHSDGNEMTGPVQPGLRAIDAIFPEDPGVKMALAGGVTTANIMPGSGNAIGGQTLYVKFKGTLIEMMRIISEILGGMKFANGENPKGYGNKGMAPGTRMKVAALQRDMLAKAQNYKMQWDNYRKKLKEDPKATPPERDLALEPMVEVLEKKRTVHFHCHRADDILTALRLSKEFGFEIVFQHCTEGYRVVEELAKAGAWVSLTLVDSPGGKPEVMGLLEENAAILHKAGVNVAINTDDFITESRFLLRTGAIAVRGGLPEDAALKALTLHGAQMMHLDHRLGSLDAGKDADFVILSGAPFSVYTQVLETYIDGEKVFDRSIHADWCYQGGGYAMADKARIPEAFPAQKPQPKVAAPEVDAKAAPDSTSPARLAIYAGRIHTVSKGTIDDGAILVEGDKITFVGKRADLKLPANTPIVSAAVVTPGLIDTHTVVGLSGSLNFKKADQDQDETSDPNQADLRVLDGFNPTEPLLQFVREQGVTVVHAMPGPANVIAGQSAVIRALGHNVEKMTLKSPAGILINLGEGVKQTYPGKISTRMGTANLVRNAFANAQAYSRKKATAKEPAAPNLKAEALELALSKKIPVIFNASRADDVLTGLRIAKEFGLSPVLSSVNEGYLIADVLKDAKAPLLLHPTMQRPSHMESINTFLGNASVLAGHEIPLAISTSFEGYVPKTRVLRYEAAMAAVNGLGFDRALKSITLDAAKILGIDDRFGTLEVGKAGDLVLYDGDPFEHATHVTHTIVMGRIAYDRGAYLKLPFERRMLPLVGGGDFGCCLGW